MIGKHLGPYLIQGEIGRGGMGVVYRALQPSLKRIVAVKALPRQLSFEPDLVRRFLREAKAAAALEHPSIITIYDVGETDGIYYFAMQYLPGETLEELIEERGRLPLKQAITYAEQLSEALEYAHERGVIHRDVKPSNILIGPKRRRVVLTDFGIALALSDTRLTKTGAVFGSPHYMAPEQLEGEDVDFRADLYALGAVIFQMLTGEPPYTGKAPVAVLHQRLVAPMRSIRDVDENLPQVLDDLVKRLMAQSAADRYQNGGEVLEALARYRQISRGMAETADMGAAQASETSVSEKQAPGAKTGDPVKPAAAPESPAPSKAVAPPKPVEPPKPVPPSEPVKSAPAKPPKQAKPSKPAGSPKPARPSEPPQPPPVTLPKAAAPPESAEPPKPAPPSKPVKPPPAKPPDPSAPSKPPASPASAVPSGSASFNERTILAAGPKSGSKTEISGKQAPITPPIQPPPAPVTPAVPSPPDRTVPSGDPAAAGGPAGGATRVSAEPGRAPVDSGASKRGRLILIWIGTMAVLTVVLLAILWFGKRGESKQVADGEIAAEDMLTGDAGEAGFEGVDESGTGEAGLEGSEDPAEIGEPGAGATSAGTGEGGTAAGASGKTATPASGADPTKQTGTDPETGTSGTSGKKTAAASETATEGTPTPPAKDPAGSATDEPDSSKPTRPPSPKDVTGAGTSGTREPAGRGTGTGSRDGSAGAGSRTDPSGGRASTGSGKKDQPAVTAADAEAALALAMEAREAAQAAGAKENAARLWADAEAKLVQGSEHRTGLRPDLEKVVYEEARIRFLEAERTANEVGDGKLNAAQREEIATLLTQADDGIAAGTFEGLDSAGTALNRLKELDPGNSRTTELSARLGDIRHYLEHSPGNTRVFHILPDVPVDFVWIPSSAFEMGTVSQTKGENTDESPKHRVAFSSGFWVGIHEVTQAQWQGVMGNNPSGQKGSNRPVSKVSWNDVQQFIGKLNQQAGGDLYRLPTEAEWEYACRAGTRRSFFGGEINTAGCEHEAHLAPWAWYCFNSGKATHPVGRLKPNSWGLYDMHGNVGEWCLDWYDKNYYEYSPATDPKGPAEGRTRIVRGGAFDSRAWDCRSANRGRYKSGYRDNSIGFRLVRVKQ